MFDKNCLLLYHRCLICQFIIYLEKLSIQFVLLKILSILMALSLLYTYICYYPIATFQKAGTCLDAQQSMAKQPIKGCE